MLRLGNLTPEQFAERVGTEFTADELAILAAARSGRAQLTGPEDFHIFDSPSISVTVGSLDAAVLGVFIAANERATYNREVNFELDDEWSRE